MREIHCILRKRDSIVISSSIFLGRQKFWDQMLHLFSLSHGRKYDFVALSFFRSEPVTETRSSHCVWTPTRGGCVLEHLVFHRFLKPQKVTVIIWLDGLRKASHRACFNVFLGVQWELKTLGLGSFGFCTQTNEQDMNTKIFCRKLAF